MTDEIPTLAIHRTGPQPWAWHLILCQTCGGSLDVSERLLPGTTIHRCRKCGTYKLAGDDQAFKAGRDAMEQVRQRAIELKLLEAKKEEHRRSIAEQQAILDQEILTSEWDDPRWTVIES